MSGSERKQVQWVIPAIGVCFAAIVLLAFASASGFTKEVDHSLLHLFSNHRTPTLTAVALAFNTIFAPLTTVGIAIAIGLLIAAVTKKWEPGLSLVICVSGAGIATRALKGFLELTRPEIYERAVHVTGSSFPSGHATGAAALVFGIGILAHYYFADYASDRNRAPRLIVQSVVWTFTVLFAIAVAISRVYLGVHWPSDVLGGYLMGSAWALPCAAYRWPHKKPKPATTASAK